MIHAVGTVISIRRRVDIEITSGEGMLPGRVYGALAVPLLKPLTAGAPHPAKTSIETKAEGEGAARNTNSRLPKGKTRSRAAGIIVLRCRGFWRPSGRPLSPQI